MYYRVFCKLHAFCYTYHTLYIMFRNKHVLSYKWYLFWNIGNSVKWIHILSYTRLTNVQVNNSRNIVSHINSWCTANICHSHHDIVFIMRIHKVWFIEFSPCLVCFALVILPGQSIPVIYLRLFFNAVYCLHGFLRVDKLTRIPTYGQQM